MRSEHRLRTQRGMTLIELLVAIGILAFVATLGWRGLDSITRARASLNQELEQTRGMQLAFAQLQSDCANVVDTQLLDGRQPVVIDSSRITLARNVHIDGQPTRVQLVTYRLNEGSLSREESAATRDLKQLDLFWQLAQDGGNALPLALQSGVQGMRLRVWSDDGRGWRSWDQAAGTSSSVPMSRGSMMNPQAGTTNSAQSAWSGLEISLSLSGREASLTKIFLLGSA